MVMAVKSSYFRGFRMFRKLSVVEPKTVGLFFLFNLNWVKAFAMFYQRRSSCDSNMRVMVMPAVGLLSLG